MRRFARGHRVIAPAAGRMVVMNGDRCLHSVRRVERGTRIALVFAYDFAGRTVAATGAELDRYLYTSETTRRDPNYAR
jgi:predicted 2-oxoglutarate/Fe(II)-dependent dioxygenase YbiX